MKELLPYSQYVLAGDLRIQQGCLLDYRPCNPYAKPRTSQGAYEGADDCAYRRSYFCSHGVTYY